MTGEHRLGRATSARDGRDREPAARDDLVGRMIAAAPAARRCCDPAEELHLPLPGASGQVGIPRMVPGQRCR